MSRISKISVGGIEVTSLTDGGAEFTADLFPNATEEELNALIAAAGADKIETNFNAFLVKNAGRTLLVDAGPRELMGPNAGFLQDALGEAGVAPGANGGAHGGDWLGTPAQEVAEHQPVQVTQYEPLGPTGCAEQQGEHVCRPALLSNALCGGRSNANRQGLNCHRAPPGVIDRSSG